MKRGSLQILYHSAYCVGPGSYPEGMAPAFCFIPIPEALVHHHVLELPVHAPPLPQRPAAHELVGAEQLAAVMIVRQHVCHELVQSQEAKGIVAEQAERLAGISPAPVFTPDEDAHLGMGMKGLVIEEVDDADGRAFPLEGYHQAELLVREEVVLVVTQVLPDAEARIGHGEVRHGPMVGMILHLVDEVQVFRFKGTQIDLVAMQVTLCHRLPLRFLVNMQLAAQTLLAGHAEQHGHQGDEPAQQTFVAQQQTIAQESAECRQKEQQGPHRTPHDVEPESPVYPRHVYPPRQHPSKELERKWHTDHRQQDYQRFHSVGGTHIPRQGPYPRGIHLRGNPHQQGHGPAEGVQGLLVHHNAFDSFFHITYIVIKVISKAGVVKI